ncbi:Histone-lysine N-methyltransferase SETMAR, partial [Harpegnathos saltator]
SWILHHDNARSHTSTLVREFLSKNSTNVAPQAPYSPDMAPCDLFLFPLLKKPLRGQRFESIEDMKEKSLRELKAVPSAAYERCFRDWIKRWHMYVASNGDYFE